MSDLPKIGDQWIPLQKAVFSRWVSANLKEVRKEPIQDLTKDLTNGVVLVELAEALTHKNSPRKLAKDPKFNVQKVENCNMAIDMLEKDGVHFVGISGKDISDGNEKLILGLIWSIILHYAIECASESGNSKDNSNVKMTKSSSQRELMTWASERTSHYPNIHNFTPFDLSMCALLDSYYPHKINYHDLDPNDSSHNAQLAVDVMNGIGIPVYVYPEDLAKNNDAVDKKTLMLQLATARNVISKTDFDQNEKDDEVESDDDKEITESENHQFDFDEKEIIAGEDKNATIKQGPTEPEQSTKIDDVESQKSTDNVDDVKQVKVHIGVNEEEENEPRHRKIKIHIRRKNGGVKVGKIEQEDNDKTKLTLLPTEDNETSVSGNVIKIRVKKNEQITERIIHAPFKRVKIVLKNNTGLPENIQIKSKDGEIDETQLIPDANASEVIDSNDSINDETSLDDKSKEISEDSISSLDKEADAEDEINNDLENEKEAEIDEQINDEKDNQNMIDNTDIEQQSNDQETTQDATEKEIQIKDEQINDEKDNQNMIDNTDIEQQSNARETTQDATEQEIRIKDEIMNDVKNMLENEIKDDIKNQVENDIRQYLNGNADYNGRKFVLTMNLHSSDYNNGNKVNGVDNADGPMVTMALELVPNSNHFMNPAGQKLDLAPFDMNNDLQQFIFGEDQWNTVIDSAHQRGMVWDVCDQFEMDPPDGTPFYLFPFHGRHNQRFIYDEDGHILATQNGDVVTYIGGQTPFVMMKPSPELKSRQTFYIHLI